MFNGYRVSNNSRVRLMVRKYNPKFYPFYSSYAGKGGDEREVDRRFNIWRSPFFLVGLPCALIVAGLGIWGVLRFLGSKAPKPAAAVAQAKSAPAAQVPAGISISEWRAVGVVSRGPRLLFVVDVLAMVAAALLDDHHGLESNPYRQRLPSAGR